MLFHIQSQKEETMLRRNRKAGFRILSAVGAVVLCVAVWASCAFAQFETATLTGVVTDATGALIAGADVRAVNESTNVESTTTANAEGRYVFTNLRPGAYR